MNEQPFRNPSGGAIDRSQPLGFVFNGRGYRGYAGDTLASALLANGVSLVARSFKYHRPRGLFGLGAEEPNGLVEVGQGARREPNVKATQVELYDGLVAASQNCWPSVDFDVFAATGWFAPLLPAGFYYKTFMAPRGRWMFYERYIRRMAGIGHAPVLPDPDRYDYRQAHCDVLVVGGGPAGLAAALAAGRSGARVILVDEASEFGGTLRHARDSIGEQPAQAWIDKAVETLRALPETVLLPRATAFGYYDHNQLGIVERVTDHRSGRAGEPRQRLWHVNAKRVVLTTGAHERSLVFGNNDLPGVMLASAARGYANIHAVRAGQRAVVFTNNDSAYAAAADLRAAGVEVRALVDCRDQVGGAADVLGGTGIEHMTGAAVLEARGRKRVTAVTIGRFEPNADSTSPGGTIDCDLLCVSGGWNPAIHLHAQARGQPVFDEASGAYVPGTTFQAECSAGSARGLLATRDCLIDGAKAGAAAARQAGFQASDDPGIDLSASHAITPPAAVWRIPPAIGPRTKRFVDLQNDVTDADIALAVREGYRSVEHVKRYTTLGMGTDQGKTSNALGFAQVARALGAEIGTVGVTTYRPPYTPVSLGALAGREGGAHFYPDRLTPMHAWHLAHGAIMVRAGTWLRPQCYPRAGERADDALRRETRNVRCAVGIADVSTLGKLELFGPDAIEFLERVYANRWRSLPVGRCRYGLMLREDGMVFDDGTTTRLGEQHFFMTTTTGQAPMVARRLTYCHQALWPDLDLHIVPVVEQWAGMAIAGPRSREVLAEFAAPLDVGGSALPYMGAMETTISGVTVRILRISYSGDLGYELHVPAGHGLWLWQRLVDIGRAYGMMPYGTDAMSALRLEKGHVAGGEMNGRTTADDLGLGRMLKPTGDYIGHRSLSRPGLAEPDRLQLVGLVPEGPAAALPTAAMLVTPDKRRYVGEITSANWSTTLQKPIGLALLTAGRSRHGERLIATAPMHGTEMPVIVQAPIFFDPEGERLRA